MGTALTPEQAEKLHRLVPRTSSSATTATPPAAPRPAARSRCCSAQGFAGTRRASARGRRSRTTSSRSEGPASLAARIEDAPDALTWLLEEPTRTRWQPGLTSAEKSERVSPGPGRPPGDPGRDPPPRGVPPACPGTRRSRSRSSGSGSSRSGPRQPAAAARSRRPGNARESAVLQGGEIPAGERAPPSDPDRRSRSIKPLILGTLKDEFLTHPGVAPGRRGAPEGLRKPRKLLIFKGKSQTLRRKIGLLLSGIALEDHPAPTEKGVEGLLKDLEKKYLERESAEIQTGDRTGRSVVRARISRS